MSAWQVLGVALLTTPFVAMFVAIARTLGIRDALIAFGLVLGLLAVVVLGSALAVGDLP